ncbi:hypothetical protein PYCC9005_004183 [Savitreella phatthalungensis]
MNELIHWFRKHGGYVDQSIEFVDTSDRGVIARCRKPIQANQRLVQVPCGLALDPRRAIPDVGFWSSIVEHDFEALLLALILICEYRSYLQHLQAPDARQSSFWHAYLAILPAPPSPRAFGDYVRAFGPDQAAIRSASSSFHCLPAYAPELEDLLLGTNLSGEAQRLFQGRLRSLTGFRALVQLHEGLNRSSKHGWKSVLYDVSNDELQWAFAVIDSRSFPSRLLHTTKQDEVDSWPILLPVIDCINHGPRARIEWRSDHTFEHGHIATVNSAVFTSLQSYAAGAEVLNNYGAKGNDAFLLGYGFVLTDVSLETVALRLGLPGDVAKEIEDMEDRRESTKAVQLRRRWETCVLLSIDKPYSEELVSAISDRLAQDWRSQSWRMSEPRGRNLGSQYDRARAMLQAYRMLSKNHRRLAKSTNRLIKDDRESFAHRSMPRSFRADQNWRNAMIYRQSQIAVLSRAVDVTKEKLKSLLVPSHISRHTPTSLRCAFTLAALRRTDAYPGPIPTLKHATLEQRYVDAIVSRISHASRDGHLPTIACKSESHPQESRISVAEIDDVVGQALTYLNMAIEVHCETDADRRATVMDLTAGLYIARLLAQDLQVEAGRSSKRPKRSERALEHLRSFLVHELDERQITSILTQNDEYTSIQALAVPTHLFDSVIRDQTTSYGLVSPDSIIKVFPGGKSKQVDDEIFIFGETSNNSLN